MLATTMRLEKEKRSNGPLHVNSSSSVMKNVSMAHSLH